MPSSLPVTREVESPMMVDDPGQTSQPVNERVCETGEFVKTKDNLATDLLQAGYYTYFLHLLHNL